MQILKLISIEGFIPGGSSKPLLITAQTQDGESSQFVMKLFKTNNIEQNYSVAKEIFINELAKEFSLNVPDYGLIKVEDKYLLEHFSKEEVSNFDKGYKFCSKYMQGYVTLIEQFNSRTPVEQYDIENLFCFDNLVYNTDRGGFRKKPNLLIKDDEISLIDHELTLPFVNNEETEPNYFNYILRYKYELHIATNYLKSLRNKENLFNEFFENLKVLNIEQYNKLFDTFEDLNISYGHREQIFAYLNWVKINAAYLNKQITQRIK